MAANGPPLPLPGAPDLAAHAFSIPSNASFRPWQLDARNDPYRGNYEALLRTFAPDAVPPLDGETILALISSRGPSINPSFMGFFPDPTVPNSVTGTLVVISLLGRYTPPLGEDATNFATVYGTYGDYRNGQQRTMVIEAEEFTPLPHQRILVSSTFEQAYNEWSAQGFEGVLGPYGGPDGNPPPNGPGEPNPDDALPPNCIRVQVRPLTAVPFCYLPLLYGTDGSRLGPGKAYQACYDYALANNLLQAHAPFFYALLVGGTVQHDEPPAGLDAEAPDQPIDPREFPTESLQATPPVPDLAPLIADWRWQLALERLPRVAPAGAATTAAPPVDQSVVEVLRLATAQTERLNQETARLATRCPVETRWGLDGVETILTLTEAPDIAHAPIIWTTLATRKKKNDFRTLDAALKKVAAVRRYPQPVASLHLLQAVDRLNFSGDHTQTISHCIQPFVMMMVDTTTPAAARATQQAELAAQSYCLVVEGENTLSVSDAKLLETSAADAGIIPSDNMEGRAMLKALVVWLEVLLGPAHALVRNLAEFVTAFAEKDLKFDTFLRKTPHSATYVLRTVQVGVMDYFNDLLSGTPSEVPDFMPLIKKWMKNNPQWVEVSLPDELLAAAPSSGGAPAGGAPAGGRQGGGAPIGGGNGARGNGSASVNSDLTGPTVTRVNRPAADEDPSIVALNTTLPNRLSISDLITAGGGYPAVPTVQRGGRPVTMCLSYHLRGGCFTNCSRAADHSRHSAADSARLLTFLEGAATTASTAASSASSAVPRT